MRYRSGSNEHSASCSAVRSRIDAAIFSGSFNRASGCTGSSQWAQLGCGIVSMSREKKTAICPSGGIRGLLPLFRMALQPPLRFLLSTRLGLFIQRLRLLLPRQQEQFVVSSDEAL